MRNSTSAVASFSVPSISSLVVASVFPRVPFYCNFSGNSSISSRKSLTNSLEASGILHFLLSNSHCNKLVRGAYSNESFLKSKIRIPKYINIVFRLPSLYYSRVNFCLVLRIKRLRESKLFLNIALQFF